MKLLDVISILAAVTTTLTLVPQILKSLQSKSVSDLSIWMIWNFIISSILWIIYGAMTASYTVLNTNIIMGILSVWILFIKLKYEVPKF